MLCVAVLLLAAAPTEAASLRKQCKRSCKPFIKACIGSGERRRVCKRTLLRSCLTSGPSVACSATPTPPAQGGVGSVSVGVQDVFNGALSGAAVTVRSGGSTGSGTTDASGTVLIGGVSSGSATVTVEKDGFERSEQGVSVLAGQTADARLVLQPASLPSVSGARVAYLGDDGVSVDFDFDVYAFDAGGNVLALDPADFSVESFDSSSGGQISFQQLGVSSRADTPRGPYSATMLLDQSGSIDGTDPADSRIQAAKLFMNASAGGDAVLLAAFASENPDLAGDVVTFGSFTTNGPSYFPQLDFLADAVDGGTPLYRAVFSMIHQTADTAPTSNRAVVVFTDGDDTDGQYDIDDIASAAASRGVSVFTVGLSSGSNTSVLAEIAARSGGAAFWAADARQLVSYYRTLGSILRGTSQSYRTRWRMSRSIGTFGSGSWVSSAVAVQTPAGTAYAPFFIEVP